MTEPEAVAPPLPEARRAARGTWASFLLLWAGQTVSVFGSRLSGFALSVWVFERTGSVTDFGWAVVLLTLPGLLIAPWAGAVVDRHSRRAVMIWSNAGAAAVTLAAVLLLASGKLQLWHLCLLLAASSVFDGFQQPAYLAAATVLVPKQRRGQASGIMQMSLAGARILAPALAGAMIQKLGLPAVLLVDATTFVVAVAALLPLRLPAPVPAGDAGERAPLHTEAAEGWRYLRQRPGLFQLMLFFSAGGLLFSMLEVLMLPLLLSFASPASAGVVASVMGAGMLAGSLAMAATGGPRRRLRGILLFSAMQGIALVAAGLRADLVLVAAAFFFFAAGLPLVNGCNQVIWQEKTPHAFQGRLFAIRRLAAQIVAPAGMLLAGPLADRVFEPLLLPGGVLEASLGALLGTGKGRGLGLLLVVLGLANTLLVAAAAAAPRLVRVESELPDAEDAG